VSFRLRVGTSGALGFVFAAAAAGTSLGAVQVVELSAQRVLPGTVVTLRVAMTGREAPIEPEALFMISPGTFGDSPEWLPCEKIGLAVEVGQIQWTAGTVEFEGASYAGVIGVATFTVPQVAVDTYRLAVSIEARGTGCHIFTSIDVVAELPDAALPLVEAASWSGQAVLLGVGLLALLVFFGRRRTQRSVGRT
jgi:hypothetical protein